MQRGLERLSDVAESGLVQPHDRLGGCLGELFHVGEQTTVDVPLSSARVTTVTLHDPTSDVADLDKADSIASRSGVQWSISLALGRRWPRQPPMPGAGDLASPAVLELLPRPCETRPSRVARRDGVGDTPLEALHGHRWHCSRARRVGRVVRPCGALSGVACAV